MDDTSTRAYIVSKNSLKENILVRASAGSGKTSILVERVVALIESSDDVHINEIIALTFTKKAANEFYERLYRKLEKRSEPNFLKSRDDPYSLLDDPNEDMKKRDLIALQYIDTCFLGTIDSFVQTILTEHPIDANIPTSSEVIDEEEFTNILVDLYHKMSHDNLYSLKSEALKFNSYVGGKNFPIVMKTILNNRNFNVQYDGSSLMSDIKSFNSSLIVLETGLNALLDYVKKNGVSNEMNAVKDSTKAYEQLQQASYIYRHISSSKYSYRSKRYYISKLKGLIVPADIKTLNPLYSLCNVKEVKKVIRYTLDDRLMVLINKIIYQEIMPFLLKAKDAIVDYLRENGKITFKESLIYAVNLLRNDDQSKIDVINNLQKKYKYYLLDECQDTDLLQYELLFRLNSSNRNQDWKKLPIEGGRLFIVGDRKQSIYHFRGADVRAYDIIEEIFKDSSNPLGKICDLSSNFRSNDDLVNYFNNTFKSFNSLEHPDIPSTSKKASNGISGVYSYTNNLATQPAEPECVADMIKKLKKENGFKYQEFMLITSSKDAIKKYLAALNKAKIPCFCEGSIDFSYSSMLVSVVNLFNYLIDKNNLFNRLSLLSSPLFNFSLDKSIDLESDLLANLISVDLDQPGSYILEEIINQQVILERLGYEGFDILVAIISLLRNEEMNGKINSLYDAVLYLRGLQEESEIERVSLLDNQIDSVHIANLHKVKGLESNVVILTKAGINTDTRVPQYCDLDRNQIYYFDILGESDEFTGRKESLLSTNDDKEGNKDKEAQYSKAEHERLLYVAATRAKELLIVNKPNKGASKWSPLINNNTLVKAFEVNAINVINTPSYISALEVINQSNIAVTSHNDLIASTYEIINASTISAMKHDEEVVEESKLPITLEKSNKDSLLFGTIVHKLMEDIVISKTNKLDISICETIAKEYDAMHLLEQLKKVYNTIYSTGFKQISGIDDNIYELIKSNECHAEVPFAIYNDRKISNGVIDLLIIKDDKAIIIDYKTDKDVTTDHTDQLQAYQEALKTTMNIDSETYIYNIQ
ncbi:MAG: UvrD-helicase domain-containing protein [Bacilli bacterium]|nr:UvrD-helicase domain-containing protein [Bacilli bacterium]